MLSTIYHDALCISAKTGLALDKLSEAVLAKYHGSEVVVRLSCSQRNGRLQHFLRANAEILDETYLDSLVEISARLGRNQLLDLERLQPETIEVVRE
jgi:50S ribosomal subunit-associated GTPase HflX